MNMTLLRPSLPFCADETQISWAGRLAAFHMGGRMASFLIDMGISRQAFQSGHPEVVDRLCDLTGQEPTEVFRNTVLRDSPYHYSLRGESFGPRLINVGLTRFCPLCLSEDDAVDPTRIHVLRRERLSWQIQPLWHCPVHRAKLLIVPERPKVGSGLSCRLTLGIDAMKALADDAQPASPSAFQDYLLGRLDGRQGPEWLDGQTLEQASRATEMLGAAMEFGTEFNPGLLSSEEWDVAGRIGWAWTSKGASGIHAAFEHLQGRAPTRGKSSSRGPGKAFGSLYRWLANVSVQTDPGPIRALLRRHILETETIPLGHRVLAGRDEVPRRQVGERQVRYN